MGGPCLKVGVLANSPAQVGEFVRLIQTAGHRASASLDASQPLPSVLPEADVWLATSNHSERARRLLESLDSTNTPIIYEDEGLVEGDEELASLGPAELRVKRAKRLANKLQLLAHGHVRDSSSQTRARAKHVWVLAASTGGPKAIAEFLDEIPATLSDVAFLYVQHIDSGTMETLKQVVDKHSAFCVRSLDAPCVIREKTVYLIPPNTQIDLLDSGVITPLDQPWLGDYSPSIDQVIAKVARVFAQRGGAIIFTGMGDDGARSSKLLHYRGGKVWVQSANSCAVDSMPVSVQALVDVSVDGAPAQLAQKLVAHFTALQASDSGIPTLFND
ncbi:chemotaxis protein CheB [Marinagarivorans cellulosilyticus]|uniref:protein-glutamate methylesterase n=1 Tax=Marinagarivorans cellulosilyticus TaxID=2721545 RepID=A0AAN1WI30_9GAMM|nr:chemotaxis protein CheB [Marinagarivorans cellulosilyticus]BCD98018.1 chemosensory pili system protein ChpB [Marinagarivorans cellulosilyticus]